MPKELFETDEGKLYYVNDFGDIFELNFDDDSESEKHENDLEEIEDLSTDYKNIQIGVEGLKYELDNLAKAHGIQLRKKTRKDFVDEWRKRKNSEHLTEDEIDLDVEITETLMEHEGKKNPTMNLKTKTKFFLEC